MILESIVTTVDSNGQVNIAPMGPKITGDPLTPLFTLRPFTSSRTYANLRATNHAVIHVTDDTWLFAQAAVDALDPKKSAELVQPISGIPAMRLRDCHRWFAVQIESRSGAEPRFDMQCRIINSGVVRPFFGFNRAKHAVIEAAILATRTHILDSDEIAQQLSRLVPLIDKTAGTDEHKAFDFLQQAIRTRIDQQQAT